MVSFRFPDLHYMLLMPFADFPQWSLTFPSYSVDAVSGCPMSLRWSLISPLLMRRRPFPKFPVDGVFILCGHSVDEVSCFRTLRRRDLIYRKISRRWSLIFVRGLCVDGVAHVVEFSPMESHVCRLFVDGVSFFVDFSLIDPHVFFAGFVPMDVHCLQTLRRWSLSSFASFLARLCSLLGIWGLLSIGCMVFSHSLHNMFSHFV